MKLLSVVLPSYNEERMIEKAATVLSELFCENNIRYELVFVDDGSKDRTWFEIERMNKINENVHGVRFSRNFGKEAAIFAGLAAAKGDCAVVMDCDLQHPPATVLEMYKLWEEGYQVVEGVKNSRGNESRLHKKAAEIFYWIISKASKIDMSKASDFKLLDRKAIDSLLAMPEKSCFFRAMSAWIGYKTTSVGFDVQEREVGQSKWSTIGLIKYAINNITGYSAAPMQIVTFAGFLTLLFALVVGIQTLVNYFSGRAIEGFTTVILLLLIIGSIMMISLGIIGYYIAKIYDEVKNRPKYIISSLL